MGALAIRAWVVEPVRVRTSSMAPTLQAGDVVLVSPLLEPRVGRVVLVDDPDGDGRQHLKRLVATGGQEVELAAGQLYVDGKQVADTRAGPMPGVRWIDADCLAHLDEPILEQAGSDRWSVLPGGSHGREVVPLGSVWLLGDNRGASSDSRHWGAVSEEAVEGAVWGILWSRSPCGNSRPDRIGALPESVGGNRW